MLFKRNIGGLLALVIPSLAALAFHAYLGSLSRFLADDYCEAYIAQHFGLFRSIWYWYLAWDGAFTGSMIDWLLAIIKSGGIAFVTPVVEIFWVFVTAGAIYLYLPQELTSLIKVLTSIAFGALTVFFTLLISPNVPQSLYWWTGMRSYTLPVVFFTFYIYLFQWVMIKWKKGSIFPWSLLSFSFIFLTGGLSETFTPVLVVFFVGWIAYRLLTKKPTWPDRSFSFILGGMLGALTSLIVVVASPGNANRQALYQAPPGIFEILNISITAFLTYLSNILMTPEKLAGFLGIFLASLWFGSFMEPKHKTGSWFPFAVLLAGTAFAIGCFVPAAWGLSDVPPDRVLSIPSFILVATLLISGFITGNTLSNSITTHKLDDIQTGLLVITLGCIVFSATVNVRNLYFNRRAYTAFARKWDMVNEQIIQVKSIGKEVVHIPIMENWAALEKPNNNPKFWMNVCYSKYYDIKILSP